MTKELEALKRFKNNIRWLEENTLLKYYFENNELHFKEDLDIIETALKEKENIEKSINELFSENGKVITTIEIKKKLKALEIMSKYDLKKSDITRFETYEEFIKAMYLGIDGKIYGKCPSKEEFDLLKEVLL